MSGGGHDFGRATPAGFGYHDGIQASRFQEVCGEYYYVESS